MKKKWEIIGLIVLKFSAYGFLVSTMFAIKESSFFETITIIPRILTFLGMFAFGYVVSDCLEKIFREKD